ncbi:hypothetical protein [Aromatoleum evansii]|uniref:hypothetical protein n=1 Tax=Aromatoleum evansii TaxID=59406 RepID=UPI00145F7403|nr:hypothetical protein [Aromatoleum evansii]NMG28424.1 hypothetical protein [Aromatoleum evansii]
MANTQDALDPMELELLADLPITPTSHVGFSAVLDEETDVFDVMATIDGQVHRTGIGVLSQGEFDRSMPLFLSWAAAHTKGMGKA